MANDLRIKIRVDSNTGKLETTQREFGKLSKNINTASTSVSTFHRRLGQMAHWGVIAYGIKQGFDAIFGSLKSLAETSIEFERFETVLGTIEGSSQKAKESMYWITDFTKSTPYQLTQVTDAFVKLKAYGIDPTNGTLRTLGDTASAMGKDLNQAVEAMADAITGENERLKEFGIKASIEGNKVAYNWTNSSGEARHAIVQNNSEIIKTTLEAIFNSKYKGAMEAQSKTFAGLVSNIQDNWTILKKSIMDNGLFNYFKAVTTVIAEMFKQSFQSMAEAGTTGANILIRGFENFVEIVGHTIDAIDVLRSGFMFFESIGAFIYKSQLYIERFFKKIGNYAIEASNVFASTELGKLIGFNTKRSLSIIDEDKFKAQINGIDNYITQNAIKIGELVDNNRSETAKILLNDIKTEYDKIKAEITANEPLKDFGSQGSFKGFGEDEKLKAQLKFEDAYKKSVLTQTEYEIYQLDKRYAEFEKEKVDEIQLLQWYSSEYDKIIANRSDSEKSWTEGIKDSLDGYKKNALNTYGQVKDMFTNSMQGMEDALVNFVKTGKLSFSNLVDSIVSDIARIVIRQSITAPLAGFLGSAFKGLFNANGNAFVNGSVTPFATGGVVSQPTLFGYSGGVGVAGEAGSELIAPLRMGNGEMGVQSKPSKVVVNITNNTGNEITADQVSEMTRTNQNGEQERIIGIVMDGVSRNKNGIRDAIRNLR